jgi:hypothetical protein
MSFFVDVIRIFQDRRNLDPARYTIVAVQLMKKTTVSAGVTGHSPDLLDLQQ